MRIAYLDTSYLSEIARLRRSEPTRFNAFREFWNTQELALAFSAIHLRETLRYGSREERFELLQLLLPVVSDLPIVPIEGARPSNLTETEILRALAEQRRVFLSRDGDKATVDQWTQVWPTRCWTAEESRLISLYDQETIQRVETIVYAAHSAGAKASSRPKDQPYKRSRLAEMEDRVLTSEETEQARAMMIAALDDPTFKDDFPWDQVGSTAEKGKAETIALIDKMLDQGRTIGFKAAYLNLLGITSPERIEKKFTDDLLQEWWFNNSVREVVTKLARGNAELCEQVIALNLLPDCPGSWLKAKVAIELKKAVGQLEPSHEYDLDHLGYLPHVDLYFCDREMAQLTLQVLRRPNLPASLAGVRPPIATPLDVDSIQAALTVPID